VIFRSASLPQALAYIKTMVVPSNHLLTYELYSVLHLRNLFFLLVAGVATIGASRFPTAEQIIARCGILRSAFSALMVFVVLPYCLVFILSSVDHPFIYFKF
jgi:hypothetical protein